MRDSHERVRGLEERYLAALRAIWHATEEPGGPATVVKRALEASEGDEGVFKSALWTLLDFGIIKLESQGRGLRRARADEAPFLTRPGEILLVS